MAHSEHETDAVKKRLEAYRDKERDIENQLERLEGFEMRLKSIGSPTLSDMPKIQSVSHDRIADIIAQKMELEEEIQGDIDFQRKERKEINLVLKKLPTSDEKAVIRMRYFDRLSWYDVTDMLFGGKADYLGKEDTYLRRTHNIHRSALINMTEIIKSQEQLGDNPQTC